MVDASRARSHDSVSEAHPVVERTALTIVGIGNEFRGDDAVGLLVLRRLVKSVPAGARTVELAGDQTYLLELLRSTDAIIVVDAVQSSAPAGTIFRVEAGERPVPKDFLSFSTHTFDSASTIELARALGFLPSKVLIYGIVGKGFSYTTRLTAELAESIEVVQAGILNDADSILSERTSKIHEDLPQDKYRY